MTRHTIVAGQVNMNLVTWSKRGRIELELIVQVLHLEAEVTTDHILVGELRFTELVRQNWAVNLNFVFAHHLGGLALMQHRNQHVPHSALETADFGGKTDDGLSKIFWQGD